MLYMFTSGELYTTYKVYLWCTPAPTSQRSEIIIFNQMWFMVGTIFVTAVASSVNCSVMYAVYKRNLKVTSGEYCVIILSIFEEIWVQEQWPHIWMNCYKWQLCGCSCASKAELFSQFGEPLICFLCPIHTIHKSPTLLYYKCQVFSHLSRMWLNQKIKTLFLLRTARASPTNSMRVNNELQYACWLKNKTA